MPHHWHLNAILMALYTVMMELCQCCYIRSCALKANLDSMKYCNPQFSIDCFSTHLGHTVRHSPPICHTTSLNLPPPLQCVPVQAFFLPSHPPPNAWVQGYMIMGTLRDFFSLITTGQHSNSSIPKSSLIWPDTCVITCTIHVCIVYWCGRVQCEASRWKLSYSNTVVHQQFWLEVVKVENGKVLHKSTCIMVPPSQRQRDCDEQQALGLPIYL